MPLQDGILSAIGNTPLVQLTNLFRSSNVSVFAKLEQMNPSGSAKDRPALRMIQEAWESKRIGPGSVIVESSSGNLAISLAMICRTLGMRFISVIDPRTTANNVNILKASGAEIEWVEQPDPETGEFLQARIRRVQELLKEVNDSHWPNQYKNPANYLSHYHTTMHEIISGLKHVDYLFCAVSTCGTIRGCAEYVKDHKLPTKIIAVDSQGSLIFGGETGKKRRFPGIGAGMVPPFSKPELIDRVIHVSDQDIIAGCRMLAAQESILAGASTGAIIAAIQGIEHELDDGAVCAVIVHDRGERYLDTIYSDAWVSSQFKPPGES